MYTNTFSLFLQMLTFRPPVRNTLRLIYFYFILNEVFCEKKALIYELMMVTMRLSLKEYNSHSSRAR
jgi:hypothetical protein